MIIRNKLLVKVIEKILNIKPYSVKFTYTNEIYDEDVTKLAFLNRSLIEFDIKVEEFRDAIQEAIQEETNQKTS